LDSAAADRERGIAAAFSGICPRNETIFAAVVEIGRAHV
jgi:hypothetical protein